MMHVRTRGEGCLADFTLDRRLARELDDAEETGVRAHLAICPRCAERYAALARERDLFAADAPPLRLPPRRGYVWPRIVAGAGAALAMAAGVALVLRVHDRDQGVRAKGAAARLEVFVNHDGVVRHGGAVETVEPGDAVRFVVNSAELPYVAVVSLDGAKRATVYYPSNGEVEAVPLGRAFPLPESTVLDDALGDERVYGVFCPRPFATEPLRRAVEALPDVSPTPDGCRVEVLHLRKEGRPSP